MNEILRDESFSQQFATDISEFKKWLYGVFLKTKRPDFLLAGGVIGKFSLPQYYTLARQHNISVETANKFLTDAGISPPTRKARRIQISDNSFVNINATDGDRVFLVDIPDNILNPRTYHIRLPSPPPRFNEIDTMKAARKIFQIVEGKKISPNIRATLLELKRLKIITTPPPLISDEEVKKPVPLDFVINTSCDYYSISPETFWTLFEILAPPVIVKYSDWYLNSKVYVDFLNSKCRPPNFYRIRKFVGLIATVDGVDFSKRIFVDADEVNELCKLIYEESRPRPNKNELKSALKEIFEGYESEDKQQCLKTIMQLLPQSQITLIR